MMLSKKVFDLDIAPGNRKDKTFTKFEAYIFLTANASQGQDINTYFLAKKWNWSRTKVKTFIEYLEENSLLEADKKDTEKNIKKDIEKDTKKDIHKRDNINDCKVIKDTKKDNEKDTIKNTKKDISKDADIGSIQAILNM